MISPVSQVIFQSQKRKRGFTSSFFSQKPTKGSFTTTKAQEGYNNKSVQQ